MSSTDQIQPQGQGTESGWRSGWIWSVSLLLGLVSLTFFLNHVAPGDPARIILGPNASETSVVQLRTEMGLDSPVAIQFGRFLKNVVIGHWGDSWLTKRPVLSEIGDHLGPTLWLAIFASIYSMVIALLLNAVLFISPRLGVVFLPVLRFGISLPSFVVAVAAALFTIRFDIRGNEDSMLMTYLVASFAVALYPACVMSTLIRNRFAEILESGYFRAARASGYPLSNLFHRVLLNNCRTTLLTAWVNQISLLVFSTIIVEWVFSLRGIGTLLIRSIQGKDLPVLSGIILLNGVFFLLVQTLSGRWAQNSKRTESESILEPREIHSI